MCFLDTYIQIFRFINKGGRKKMKEGLFRKTLVLAVICLFIGAGVIQNITLNVTAYDPPETEWNRVFGGSGCDEGYSVIETSDNSFLLAGVTTSYGNGDYDGWLIKTDSDGNEIWNKTFGGISQDQFLSIDKTSDNGFIVAGSTKSYGAGDNDVWLIKTDSDGNEIWNRTFGGMGYDFACSVQQTIDSGFILTGVKDHALGMGELWLIKTDNGGIMEWNKTFDAPGQDIGNSVQQTSDGGYIIGGEKGLSVTLKDLWVIKTDADGNEIWNVSFDGGGKDVAESIQETIDGGYIITGFKKFGSYEGDLWLIKINDTGVMQWDKTFGEGGGRDMGHSVVQTTDGGYIVAGRKGMYNINTGDLWIIKTDEYGNMTWDIILGESPIDVGRSIIQIEDGGYIILGFTESYGSGGRDFWLIKVAKGRPDFVYVDDNYNASTPGWGYDHFDNIQDGIDAVAEHGTVYVYSGTYYENMDVNKSLTIKSTSGNPADTIVNASNLNDHAFNVTADYVNISGFTVKMATGEHPYYYAGIFLNRVNHCNISYNNASNNQYGIYLYYSNNSIIANNIANSNTLYGVYLYHFSANNTLMNNTASNNDCGICLYCSSSNTLTSNTMSGNNYNLYIDVWSLYQYIQNIDTSNEVDGKPVYYLVDQQDRHIPDDAGFVGIVNSRNITVKDLILTNNGAGVLLANSSNSRIENITVSDNIHSIVLSYSCSNNNLTNNIVSDNRYGISLVYPGTNNNILTNNYVSSNLYDGILLHYANNNRITNNTVLSSTYSQGIALYHSGDNTIASNTVNLNHEEGIWLWSTSNNNSIYNNYFNNTNNAYDLGNNTWNITKTAGTNIIGGSWLGGNYWSDYTGEDLDGDGLGDMPYDIHGGSNQDMHPLVELTNETPVADANGPYTGIVGDSVHFDGSDSYDPDGTIISYNWDFGDGHIGTGVKPSHKYSSSGTYDITLTVTDDDGLTDTNDTTVVITHGNPPSVQLIYPTGGEILKDTVTIEWYAHDSKDGDNLPIYLYYFDEDDNWYQINDVLENTGEYDWDTTKLPDGTYELLIQAVDSDGNIGHDSSEPFEIDNHYEPENEPPNKPNKPSGETSGKAGEEYTYSTTTTDPDGDQVWYKWDWGDETSGWDGPYDSGDTVTASHIWDEKGDYNIKVKAKDVHGEESPWSDPLPITMPKNKAINLFLLFLERLIERFPILERILQPIFERLQDLR